MRWDGVVWSLLLFSGVTVSNVTVRQTPSSVSVTEGGTLHLYCDFTLDTNHSKTSVVGALTWYKDTSSCQVCNKCSEYIGRVRQSGSSSFRDFQKASLAITEVKPNDTGRYYCSVDLTVGGQGTGQGTEVTVNIRDESEVTSVPFQGNIYLLIFAVLAVVFFVLILVKIISTLHCCGPPDKRTESQGANKEGDAPENIIYANLNIPGSNSLQPPDRIACESVRSRLQNKNPIARGSLSLPESTEESVVYSSLWHPAYSENSILPEPVQTPRRKAEQVVYAAVRV